MCLYSVVNSAVFLLFCDDVFCHFRGCAQVVLCELSLHGMIRITNACSVDIISIAALHDDKALAFKRTNDLL